MRICGRRSRLVHAVDQPRMPPPSASTSKAGLGESMLLEEWPTAVARIKKNLLGGTSSYHRAWKLVLAVST